MQKIHYLYYTLLDLHESQKEWFILVLDIWFTPLILLKMYFNTKKMIFIGAPLI